MEIILSSKEARILDAYAQKNEVSKLQAAEHLLETEMDSLTSNDGKLKRTPMMNKLARYPSQPDATDNQTAFPTSPRLVGLAASIERRWPFGSGKAPDAMPEVIPQALIISAIRRLESEGIIRLATLKRSS